MRLTIIGAGLAGCESAYLLSKRGIEVLLVDKKPKSFSPAHHSPSFAELVCSNSLRSDSLENAAGLLKEELRRLDSLIISCADLNKVPAGGALAVDREEFSSCVTKRIKQQKNITVISDTIKVIPSAMPVIVASGPLTDEVLFCDIQNKIGQSHLHFFDAAAPIVAFDSIDMTRAYFASRYDKGTPDYINCPMTKQEYYDFYNELIAAECSQLHEFEDKKVFEGCMPVEVMAKRGKDTLLYGPLKPVGLIDKRTNIRPYAVVQLRKDNSAGTLYNIVGFQTHLKFPEQKRVFSMIPGLENAVFERYGVMHKNTFINSPKVLNKFYQLKSDKNIYFAGQMTGVEGYVESTASGFSAGLNLALELAGKEKIDFTKDTAIGALAHYISDQSIVNFQPMNINFGIINTLGYKVKGKKEKNLAISKRALDTIEQIKKDRNLNEVIF
jgi:methylenetetrahydrofolate--tRNA-(uracil-5-)-methyltransferase